jgi:hypothetical protein
MSDREKDLRDDELDPIARRLEDALAIEAPEARGEKAMFVAAVGARRRSRSWVTFAPALAAVTLLVALGVVSRGAQPGQTLFPVRKVLGNVGLAPSTAKEVRVQLDRADALLVQASSHVASEPGRAQELVRDAWGALDRAEELADELDSDRRATFEDAIDDLEDRADAAYEAAEEAREAREEAAEEAEEEREDSSGSGSGGGEDDSSGSGSGGSDDEGGSGSGGDDDSSGSGSGGSDDDNSGSGSGGDDDSSGSGSGGSDDDDSGSGSGSGDDD